MATFPKAESNTRTDASNGTTGVRIEHLSAPQRYGFRCGMTRELKLPQIEVSRGVTIGGKQRRSAVWKNLQAVFIAVRIDGESKVFRLRPGTIRLPAGNKKIQSSHSRVAIGSEIKRFAVAVQAPDFPLVRAY